MRQKAVKSLSHQGFPILNLAKYSGKVHRIGDALGRATAFRSEPHLPYRPSGKFAVMYDLTSVPEWEGFRETFEGKPYIQRQQLYNWGIEHFTWKVWAPIVARYYGMISHLDDAIGSVLTALDTPDAADNTIVIFTADHGDMSGSHRIMDKHYNSL